VAVYLAHLHNALQVHAGPSIGVQGAAEAEDDVRTGRTSRPAPAQLNLFNDPSPARSRLPRPQATEEEVNPVNPNQQSFNFGSNAEDFRSGDEIQKDLLTKIFNTLFDISKNVSLMTEGFPDLLEASKSVDKLKDPNKLADQETKNEEMARSLKASGASVIQNTAEGVFGFFEKLFAILTPFLLGFILGLADLTNPIQLLKNALLGLAIFIAGKFIFQLGKALTLTLISKLLEKFVGPKIINAPNSIINTGGLGAPGTGGRTGGRTGGTGGRTGGATARSTTPAVGGLTPNQKIRYDELRAQGMPPAEAKRQAGGFSSLTRAEQKAGAKPVGNAAPISSAGAGITPPATTATGRAIGGIKTFGKSFLPLAIATSLISAPALFASKKEEGKSTVRAGTETGASIGGGLVGGVLTGAATGAALGAMGLNPFTVALGATIGGIAGGIVGEQIASSFTEGLFDFFTGSSKAKREVVSIFSKEYDDLSIDQKLSPEQRAAAAEEIMANPAERERLRRGADRYLNPLAYKARQVEAMEKYNELPMFSTMNRLAREKPFEPKPTPSVMITRGGDTNQQMIVNRKASEAEPTQRGMVFPYRRP
jgi:hypothetical protein